MIVLTAITMVTVFLITVWIIFGPPTEHEKELRRMEEAVEKFLTDESEYFHYRHNVRYDNKIPSNPVTPSSETPNNKKQLQKS